MRRITKNKQLIVHQLQNRNSMMVWWSHMDHCHRHPLRTKICISTISKLSLCSNGRGELKSRTRVAGTEGEVIPIAPEGPVEQHRNIHKTNTYVTLTSLPSFAHAARRPVRFGRRSRSRSPSCDTTLHCGSFCLSRHPSDRRAAATAANRIAYCDR